MRIPRRKPGSVTHTRRDRRRSSHRFRSLYRGVRGFVLGEPPASPTTRPPGPARAPVEDQVGRIRFVDFVRSPRSDYRLNLVLPTIDAARSFGGIRTALDLFEAIGAGAAERRIVAVGERAGADGPFGPYLPVEAGTDPPGSLQFAGLDRHMAPLAIRPTDVFVTTFWTTADLVGRIRAWQSANYGWAPDRLASIIQDFEPGFYAWSAQWVAAQGTFGRAGETVALFNTALLRDHFASSGIRFAREFTFEPRLLPELRAAMARPAVTRTRSIVVYGRPGTPRNAFPAIIDGLRLWRAADPNAPDWTVLSVGQRHPPFDLGGGATLRSVGKLDLDAYADLLRGSAIGVSLMISPHPSYPPLEMAHLGMLVLTNRFGAKDLSSWHSNIQSIEDLSAEAIAGSLSELCRRFEVDPDVGAAGRSRRPAFTSDEPQFPFASDVAAELGDGAEYRPSPG